MRLFRSFILLILPLFVLSCSNSSEPETQKHNVRGTVVHWLGQVPVEGAVVVLQSLNDTIITGADGKFEFKTEGGNSETITVTGIGIIYNWKTLEKAPGTYDFGMIEVNVHATLAAYYPLDGNLNSQHGSDNGTLSPEVAATTDRFGFAGRALSFNAIGSLGTIPHSPTFNFSSSEGFAISCWVKIPQIDETIVTNYPIVGKGADPFDENFLGYHLHYRTESNIYPRFILGTTKGNEVRKGDELKASKTNWHHLVVVVDANRNETRIALDGTWYPESFPGISPNNNGNCNNTDPVLLGGIFEGGRFRGDLDDLRFYRGILDDDDLFNLYHERGF